MKRELVDILVCPLCKGRLELAVGEEVEGEVISGALFCAQCQLSYPIEDAIPNLLPPEQR